MDDAPRSRTWATLLARLRLEPSDQAAWGEFVAHYGPVVRSWCQRWHLQEADVEDVTQNVLLRLSVKLPDFVYDSSRSFRAWLKTLTKNACSDFLRRCAAASAGSGDSAVQHLLESVPAQEDLLARLDEAFDRELLAIASESVKARVAPQTWEAFRLTAIEGVSGADAAARIPMQVSQVYVAKRRVQQMLQEELSRLDDTFAGPPG
jgi:RNA polymerase sigma factor (sigma-70 family)